MTEEISNATLRNWQKLNVDKSNKLLSRANKSRSKKFVLPTSYLPEYHLEEYISNLLSLPYSIDDIIYSLCRHRLSVFGLLDKEHVQQTFAEYSHYRYIPEIESTDILSIEKDILGYIYQAMTPEGERNKSGKYYTLEHIVSSMTHDIRLSNNERFLDPCCGSGAFLLQITTPDPENLYGIDIDPLAVMIAKTNLLIRYRDHIFCPHIFCFDFLQGHSTESPRPGQEILSMTFDYIYTNPPWGGTRRNIYHSAHITSKERASLFLEKSYFLLKEKGVLKFLLPISILNISVHNDIRNFICKNTTIQEIQIHNQKFNGVYTDFFAIKLSKERPASPVHQYTVSKESDSYTVSFRFNPTDKSISIPISTSYDAAILSKLEQRRNDDLSHSEWALGIVTGDNKGKLTTTPSPSLERIYTGKEIEPYTLKDSKYFIHYDRTRLQQCAKDELYRAPQKLVYKFISKKLVFAYDDQRRLFLNSANILIPSVDSFSIKSVLAFLNSELYQFVYQIRFKDIKILKGNLSKLPFPKLTPEEDLFLRSHVDELLNGRSSALREIEDFIYRFFNISQEERNYITNFLYG